jgi:hypothetical protein
MFLQVNLVGLLAGMSEIRKSIFPLCHTNHFSCHWFLVRHLLPILLEQVQRQLQFDADAFAASQRAFSG